MIDKQIDSEFAERKPLRPLRDMILLLPHLQVGTGFDLGYESADPDMLLQIGTNAEITMRTVHRGVAAIGKLLVYVSPEIGTGEFPAESMEAIGWLLAELGDLACVATTVANSCQRYTADYTSESPKHTRNVRP